VGRLTNWIQAESSKVTVTELHIAQARNLSQLKNGWLYGCQTYEMWPRPTEEAIHYYL